MVSVRSDIYQNTVTLQTSRDTLASYHGSMDCGQGCLCPTLGGWGTFSCL